MGTFTKNTETTGAAAHATGSVDLVDLSDLVTRVTAAAEAAGAVVLDRVSLSENSASVTLTSAAHLETLLHVGAAVLYVDEAVLTADRADEMSAPVAPGDRDPAAARELDDAGRQLRTHLGQTASVTLVVAYAGVLHVLEVTAPWLDDFHLRILRVGQAQVEAMEAANAAEDRAYAARIATVTAWFDAVVDRLVADDTWLALSQEAGRKQHVRDLAKAELGPSYEEHLPHGRTPASLVNQAVQLAFSRRASCSSSAQPHSPTGSPRWPPR